MNRKTGQRAATSRQRAVLTSWLAVIGLAAVAFLVVHGPAMPAARGTAASAIPAPTLDEPATGRPKAETAVLAGGCFWGVQGVFQHVSYGKLLQIFFAVVQDPTELNRQGPDVGASYRSEIFAQDDTQQKIANAYIAQLNGAGVFPAPIVTTVSSGAQFFPAEAYHQNFLDLNPNNPYIVANDLPKLGALQSTFPELYRG
jgi:peptide-methionine (S)-S-oxide reductase